MSFNLGSNSSSHRANDTEWIKRVAFIIEKSDADIVLLQEVPAISDSDTREEFLRRLKDNLITKRWSSISTVNALSNKAHPEKKPSFTLNNAVLYNSDLLQAFFDGRYPINFSDPKCFTNYKTRFNNLQVITFAFRDSLGKKFYVINTHTYAADPESDLRVIGNVIRDFCSNSQPFIIGGDINMNLMWTYNTISNYANKIQMDGFYNIAGAGIKTSLSSSNSNGKIILANDYDHFIYSSNITALLHPMRHAITGFEQDYYTTGQININGKNYQNNTEFIKEISDHFPILIQIDINITE